MTMNLFGCDVDYRDDDDDVSDDDNNDDVANPDSDFCFDNNQDYGTRP